MAQFDVHPTQGNAARFAPFLVELQSDAVAELASVIVAPMRRAGSGTPLTRLCLPAELDGQHYEIGLSELSAIPRRLLAPPVTNLGSLRAEFITAIDFLFSGV